VNVAGESHYQEALQALTGTDGRAELRLEVEAVLATEPANPHDPNAVMVQIDDRLVGYLPRSSAVDYAPLIAAVEARGRSAAYEAMIAARGGETSALGVFLRPPKPDEAAPAAPRGAF